MADAALETNRSPETPPASDAKGKSPSGSSGAVQRMLRGAPGFAEGSELLAPRAVQRPTEGVVQRHEPKPDAPEDPETKVKALVTAGKHDEALTYICTKYGFTGGNFEISVVPAMPDAWATTGGEIKEGAKQTLKIGKDLFDEPFVFIVRTIGHEFQHLVQRSQKNPIENQAEREFLAWAWEALDESVPKYTPKVAADHAKKALEYWAKMPKDRQDLYPDKKKKLDDLIASVK